MPPRGVPALWPIRILTDFGKSAYVLWLLAGALFAFAILTPRLQGTSRSLLLGFGTRLQFLFFAVLVPVLMGEIVKWIVGRGRPFVGGEANPFNFAHFAGTEAYASFPSVMRSRASRWLSRLPRFGRRRGLQWRCMPS